MLMPHADTLSMLAVSVLAGNISQPLLVEQSEVSILDDASLKTRHPANGSAEPIGSYGKADALCIAGIAQLVDQWDINGFNEQMVDLPCNVSLEAADDLTLALALSSTQPRS